MIYEVNQIRKYINHARDIDQQAEIKETFATIAKQDMQPQFGMPHLYHDEMNIVGKHLWEMRHRPEWTKSFDENIISPYILNNKGDVKKCYKYIARKDTNNTASMKVAAVKCPKKLT